MLQIAAYAKINLGLRVLGRRADGYHQIETRFQSVTLADELRLEPASESFEVEMSPSGGVLARDNLVYRAAKLLRAQSGRRLGARISIRKRIPFAAGLGGGSSDAVATLVALNALWQLELSPARMQELAGRLGSDLPLFLVGGLCRGSGRGEQLAKLPAAYSHSQIVLFKPDCRLGAAEVYAELDRLPPAPLPQWADPYANELSAAAMRLCPKLLAYQRLLSQQQIKRGGLSGSGPSCYAILTRPAEAQAFARLAQQRLGGWVRLVEASPTGYRWIRGPELRNRNESRSHRRSSESHRNSAN